MAVMKEYKIVWRIGGTIWVVGDDEDDAKKKVMEKPTDELFDDSDMEEGLEVLSIEEV